MPWVPLAFYLEDPHRLACAAGRAPVLDPQSLEDTPKPWREPPCWTPLDLGGHPQTLVDTPLAPPASLEEHPCVSAVPQKIVQCVTVYCLEPCVSYSIYLPWFAKPVLLVNLDL